MRLPSLLIAVVAAAWLGVAGAVAAQQMSPDQRQAMDAAEKWLAPIDAGRYQDAWPMAAEPLKKQVGRDQFRDGLKSIRKDFGKFVSRSGERVAYVGIQPGPDYPTTGPTEGMKIVFMFDTRFAGNKKATEEITMLYEKDGLWRVASYYIK